MKNFIMFFLVFNLIGLNTVNSQLPTNGLVGYWPFNNSPNDFVGTSNASLLGVVYSNDRFNNPNFAINFDGLNDSVIIPHSSSLNFSSNQQTISFFLKIADYPNTGHWQILFSKLDGSSSNYSGFQVIWDMITANGLIYRFISGNNSWGDIIIPYKQIPLNSSVNITFTTDGDTIKSYLNGIFISSNIVPSTASIGVNSSPITIGHGNWHWTPNILDFFNGILDEIILYDRELSSNEVNSIFNSNVYDTIHAIIYDTINVTVQDTIYTTVYDTINITVQDTIYMTVYDSISVTDTLIIDVLSGSMPPFFNNVVKIYPNPTKDHIYVNYGDYLSMSGFTIKITNLLNQEVYNSYITQQQSYIDLSSWTGSGTYFVRILNFQGNIIAIRKIILQ